MRKILCVAVMALSCFSALLNANIIRVTKIGSPVDGEFHVIQAAINASVNGDTVLVYPGRFVENLNLNGKSITLASMELLTRDRAYVYRTIVDGGRLDSVIQIRTLESNVTIRGITITNGSGHIYGSFNERFGGGIFARNMMAPKQINVVNCNVTGNRADIAGGINAGNVNLYLSGTRIVGNRAKWEGGGLYLINNMYHNSTFTFDSVNRCNIYNNIGSRGADIFDWNDNSLQVIVDTFTVALPNNFYACARPSNENISHPYDFDILHYVHEEVNRDIYVAPWGNDTNDGFSPANPMKTIYWALNKIGADSLNPKTLHLADGHYSQSLNGQIFPLPLKENMNFTGASRTGTILDGENMFGMLNSNLYSNNIKISNLTIINAVHGIYAMFNNTISVKNVDIRDCVNTQTEAILSYSSNYTYVNHVNINNYESSIRGSGIYVSGNKIKVILNDVNITECSTSHSIPTIDCISNNEVVINRCSITNNHSTSEWPNSLSQVGTWETTGRFKFEISNCLFADNTQVQPEQMANFTSLNDVSSINNCTFTNNSGGTSVLSLVRDISVNNCILYNPAVAYEIKIFDFTSDGVFTNAYLNYNNIRNGVTGVFNETNLNHVFWGEGNTSADPQFVGSGDNPYSLLPTSPLIDAGTPNADSLDIPGFDLLNNPRIADGNGDGIARIDIGAYEYTPEDGRPLVRQGGLPLPPLSNYPNPFVSSTMIGYNVPKDSETTLSIYNAKGQQVRTLASGQQKAGQHSIIWDALDDNGRAVSSGVYLYRLESGGKSIQKKMILLK